MPTDQRNARAERSKHNGRRYFIDRVRTRLLSVKKKTGQTIQRKHTILQPPSVATMTALMLWRQFSTCSNTIDSLDSDTSPVSSVASRPYLRWTSSLILVSRLRNWGRQRMNFTPTELTADIRKHIPEIVIDYDVDPVRHAIAGGWPRSMEITWCAPNGVGGRPSIWRP